MLTAAALGPRLAHCGYVAADAWALRPADGIAQGNDALGQRLTALPALPNEHLLLFQPPLPLMPRLLRLLPPETTTFTPRDSETAVFLTDIPLLGASANPLPRLADRRALWWGDAFLLRAATPHQAYVIAACLHHALLVAALVAAWDQPSPELIALLAEQTRPLPVPLLPELDRGDDRSQAIATGQAMVRLGLVDAVFGNLSVRADDRLLISCTGSALNNLSDDLCTVSPTDPAADDRRASSELPAHRAIYAASDSRVLVHGHPRLSIALSLTAAGHQQLPDGTPVVWAAPGSRQLGEQLAMAATSSPRVMAGGHGPFIQSTSFADALTAMLELENACRLRFRNRLGLP